MEHIAVSVIVPIYNAEPWLEECVQSILDQDFPASYGTIEVLLIDDGATDGSGALCDRLAKRDNRIKVVHQENQGLSGARNTGIDMARGRYYAFIDSDDVVRPAYLKKMYEACEAHDAYMAICAVEDVQENGKPLPEPVFTPPTQEGVFRGKDLLNDFYAPNGTYYTVAWNKLYRAEVWKLLHYPEGRLHEDDFVAHRLFWRCDKVVCLPDVLYNYRLRSGSIMRTSLKPGAFDAVDGLADRYRFYVENGVNHIVKLLPGGRIGALSDEILAEIRESNGKPDAKIIAIRSGNVQLVRQLQNEHIEGKELATTELEEWEESMAGPSGPFDVTYCQPKTPTPPKGRPCILYLHGGGWQYGSRKVVLPFCRYLAEQANAVVAVPEYHLAPEHRWPAALEDCWQLLCRLHAQAETRGIDPARITVAGDSAGGNLAALCAHRDRDRSLGMVNSQMLYYPALSVRETDGLKDYHFGLEDYIYDDAQSEWIVPRILAIWNAGKRSEDNYLPEGVNSRMASVSPLWDSDFSGLPRTLLITAQYDYLTSQAKTYAHYLAAAHVPVTWVNYCGVGHAFVDKCGVYPQADDSLKMAAEFVR